MTIYKRLLHPNERSREMLMPVSDEELAKREKEYPLLNAKRFGFNRTKDAFKLVSFRWKGETFNIQYNACGNLFCKNHGLPTLNCTTSSASNWPLTEEIERLIRINTVTPIVVDYIFHKPSCPNDIHTPFANIKSFHKRGMNSASSQRYQCKECKKITSVKPNKSRRTNFNQKRNDILPLFAKLLINKTPISRACEIPEIGHGTYYQKLERLYQCCVEFLETRETKTLEGKVFKDLWVTTDKLHYVL